MKWYPVIPYERKSESLFHFPEVSSITGRKIDWRYGKPLGGFEAVQSFGFHTLEISGLPMGKTPEYMQERLRRYFSKYGPVVTCRAINHPLDPYQCEGTAYVSFRQADACAKAASSVIKFGPEMGNRVLKIRSLSDDKVVDGRSVIKEWENNQKHVLQLARDLYFRLQESPGLGIEDLFTAENKLRILGEFDSVETFLTNLSTVFILKDNKVFSRRLVDFEAEIKAFETQHLAKTLQERLSVPWRINSPVALPEYTKRRINLWDKKDQLPFDLEVLSRDMRQHRVHGEKFLVAARAKRERAHRRAENRKMAIAARRN